MPLIGYIEGNTLLFKEVAPNKYACELPVNSGRHYITLHIVNADGIVDTRVHSIALVDFSSLTFKVLNQDKNYEVANKYDIEETEVDKYVYEVYGEKYVFSQLALKYAYEVII